MTSTKPLFAICSKLGKITNQIVGTQQEIVPGDLLKIILVNKGNAGHYVIKLYDGDNKRFGKELYQCDKGNVNELDDNVWSFVSELREGSNITVNMEVPIKVNVNFRIKYIGDVPELGAGRFYALDLIDNGDLSEDNKFHMRMKYYNTTLSAFCIRCDRIIENLRIDQIITQPVNISIENYQPPTKIDASPTRSTPTNKKSHLSNVEMLANPFATSRTNPASQIRNVSEALLIDFEEMGQIGKPLKTFVVPPINLNKTARDFSLNNAIDPQLQNLRNGLSDLRDLTEKEPNGMNEYARINQHQVNVIDHDLQERNNRIQESCLVGCTTTTRYATPPSDTYYREHNIKDFRIETLPKNVPAAILRKLNKPNVENSSIKANYKQFDLPQVDRDEPTYNDIMIKCPIEIQTPSNYAHQNLSPDPRNTNVIKKIKPRKNRRRNQGNNSKITTRCYVCQKLVGNAIQLDCQHVFCSQCLVNSVSSLEDAHCPFKKGNYSCGYKLDNDDIKYIVEAINTSLGESGTNNTQIIAKPKQHISEPRSTVKKVEEDLVYDDDGSSEVLFYCKQTKCTGYWFVDRTEGRRTYPCPLCGTYNCFKCQVIHDNMTCEEYNQHNPGHQNNNSSLGNCRIANDEGFNPHAQIEPKWICEFCGYKENLMDTAICVLCSRTSDTIINSKTSSALEYYRLLELEENDNFIPNFDEFECIICTEMIEPDDGVQLRGCLHNFCHTCIHKYIEGQDQPQVECPFDGCTNILEDREIKTLVSPQLYERYLEISLRVGKTQIKNGYQCCVPNCQGYWIFTANTYVYNCPVCRIENCVSCKASHPGIDCKTYQQNLFYSTDKNGVETRQRLEQLLKTGEAEHCPNCNIIVVKNGGCPAMICSMCQTNFKWGQKTNRDLNIK